jgi:predicted DCC family thiol-disulfide oxidoreductase YuxK
MYEPPQFPLEIFYDGSCSVCAAEMAHYRRREQGGRLVFIDISTPEFDPVPYGIPREAFMYEMHAIDRQGRVFRGVSAFRAIWQAFPPLSRYGLMALLVSLPGVGFLARLSYRGFARIRKYLPKKRHDCRDGTCSSGRSS